MVIPSPDVAAEIAAAVSDYHRQRQDVGILVSRIRTIAERAEPDTLASAVQRFLELPEVVIPAYERIVAARPDDAQAMVILANAYWLTGRGPAVVGELAARALAADPANRGAWHLWALAEPDLRQRTARWRQVADRFPRDELALALFADSAASLASTEQDAAALADAIDAYESLLSRATQPEQREALLGAINTLRTWRL